MDYSRYVISVNMTGKRWVYWCSKDDAKPVRIHSAIAEYRIAQGAFVAHYEPVELA